MVDRHRCGFVHTTTLPVQVGVKSNDGMDMISIGEAATRLQMAPSALRYYDGRGLVRPKARRAGTRMYGACQMVCVAVAPSGWSTIDGYDR